MRCPLVLIDTSGCDMYEDSDDAEVTYVDATAERKLLKGGGGGGEEERSVGA